MTDPSSPRDSGDPELGRGLFDEEMGPSSALAHLYRGEVHRMKLWRERLDRTTDWAVIVLAAILTWAFSSPTNPHYIILVGIASITIFLVIEARRYRGYDIWRTRARVLQENVFAVALDEDRDLADPRWRENLSRDYLTPTMKVPVEEAIAHRLRRVYLPLFFVLLVAWLVRITAFSTAGWPASAAIGPVSGVLVSAGVGWFFLSALAIAFRPRTWKGELLDEHVDAWDRHREF